MPADLASLRRVLDLANAADPKVVVTPLSSPGARWIQHNNNTFDDRLCKSVRLLGVAQPLKFQQSDAALVIDLPQRLPTRHASAFRISFGA